MNEQELIELRKYACSHLGLDENEWLLNKTDYFVMRRRIVYLYLFFKGKKIVDIAKDAGKLPQTKLAIIVLNKVGGQCKIIQRSDSIRCSGCNINSKDLVDSILHFSGYERANVGNILDFQFYSCDIENKEQTYTLFVLPQFLTLNHKR